MKDTVKFLPTTDNWYGTFEGNKCKAHFVTYPDNEGYAVYVSGTDDYALVYEGSLEEVTEKWNEIIKLTNVTQDYLKSIGFENAG